MGLKQRHETVAQGMSWIGAGRRQRQGFNAAALQEELAQRQATRPQLVPVTEAFTFDRPMYVRPAEIRINLAAAAGQQMVAAVYEIEYPSVSEQDCE